MVFFVLFFFLLEYKVRTSLFLCAKKKKIFPCVPSQLKRQQFVLSVLTEVRLWGQTVSSNNIALSSALKSIQIYLKKYTRKEKDLSASRRRGCFHRPCLSTVPIRMSVSTASLHFYLCFRHKSTQQSRKSHVFTTEFGSISFLNVSTDCCICLCSCQVEKRVGGKATLGARRPTAFYS